MSTSSETDTPASAVDVASNEADFEIVDGVLISYSGTDSIVTVPDSVTSIGDSAFRDNTTITELHLGKNVTSIGEYIVRGCTSLTTLSLPDGDTPVEVSYYSLMDCDSITTIHLSETVVSVDEAFLNLRTVQELEVHSRFELSALIARLKTQSTS